MKKFLLLFLIFLNGSVLFSQQNENEIEKPFFAGGAFGAQFGTIVNLNFAPHAGYYFNKFLGAGIGGTYQYYKDKRYSITYDISGFNVFTRLDIHNRVYLHGEYEILTYKTDIFSPIRNMETIISQNLLVGAGYRQLINDDDDDKSSFYIMLLYNLNETIYTPYSNPLLRVGVEYFF